MVWLHLFVHGKKRPHGRKGKEAAPNPDGEGIGKQEKARFRRGDLFGGTLNKLT